MAQNPLYRNTNEMLAEMLELLRDIREYLTTPYLYVPPPIYQKDTQIRWDWVVPPEASTSAPETPTLPDDVPSWAAKHFDHIQLHDYGQNAATEDTSTSAEGATPGSNPATE